MERPHERFLLQQVSSLEEKVGSTMAETPDTIFEEREEELLISATSSGTENPTLKRTAHFLKPCVTQLSGHENELLKPHTYKNTIFSENKKLPFKIYFKGWRFPLKEWENWVENLLPKHQSTWKKVGIYDAIMVSVYKIPRDKNLVLGLAEKWSSITNSFVFTWGEATVTLEDVMVLGGFSVLGESVLAQIDDQESVDIRLELIEKLKEAATPGNLTRTATGSWLRYFMGSGSELEHEAFLSYWLSQHVFPTANYFVGQHVFPIAIRLARGIRIALAPAILAGVYSELRLLNEELVASSVLGKDEFSDVTLVAHFQLVQLWAWKRFPTLPKPLPFIDSSPKPRPARWKDMKIVPNGNIRMALDSAGESFHWRPYASSADYWLLHKFGLDKERSVLVDQDLDEELETLARCLRVSELVGINCIEQYLPHRVSKQFGMDQDIPHPVARCNGTRSVAWSNYSRPIRDAKLYIPSRHFMAGVTVQYSKWWKNSALNQSAGMKSHVTRPRNTTRSAKRINVENKELPAEDFTPRRRFLNLHTMEVERYPSRGQEEFLESLGNHNRAAKAPELATSVEHLSGFRHQNVSSLGENSRVIEEASMTGRTTTASKSVLFVERVIANPADSTQEGRFITAEVEVPSGSQQQNVPIAAAKSRVAEDKERVTPMTDQMTTASNSQLSVGEIAGNEENPPADSSHEGHVNAMEVFNSAIRCQDGVQESTGNADDNEKEPERAAVAAELPSGYQHQNVSNSAEDHTVDEEIDPVKMFSKPALCPKDVNNKLKSRSSSRADDGRVVENTESTTPVIDLTNEEDEAGIQVLREIPGMKLEARIRRLERILKYLKKTR